jgi:hypothetical protein
MWLSPKPPGIRRPDHGGRLESRNLYRRRMLLGKIYQAELAEETPALGYDVRKRPGQPLRARRLVARAVRLAAHDGLNRIALDTIDAGFSGPAGGDRDQERDWPEKAPQHDKDR